MPVVVIGLALVIIRFSKVPMGGCSVSGLEEDFKK